MDSDVIVLTILFLLLLTVGTVLIVYEPALILQKQIIML